MLGYRYTLGDFICFRARSHLQPKMPESFEITALLPPRDGVAQYRVRSDEEKHERVVLEDEIELVSSLAANSNIPADLRNG
jgi:hypothetical protein